MISYIIRRLLLMVPTLVGITLVVFFVMALAPGGIGAALRSEEGNMRPEQRAEVEAYLKRRYGLDRPLPMQYLRWLNQVSPVGLKIDADGASHGFGIKAPDLGESFLRRQPVLAVVAEALPPTLILNLITIPITYAVAITSGIYAARYRGKMFDVASGTTFLALWSIPVMWVGVMLLGFLASKDYWPVFPTGDLHSTLSQEYPFLPHRGPDGFSPGWLLDAVWHLILPVTCLTLGSFAFLSKLMRAAMLENLSADFARTARAKGVSDQVILFRHVLRNSILPLITIAASILPGLLGGSLIVEQIFSIKGMGKLMIDAIYLKDREVVMSETLVVGLLSLVSLLIADLCYAIADPRVSFE